MQFMFNENIILNNISDIINLIVTICNTYFISKALKNTVYQILHSESINNACHEKEYVANVTRDHLNSLIKSHCKL